MLAQTCDKVSSSGAMSISVIDGARCGHHSSMTAIRLPPMPLGLDWSDRAETTVVLGEAEKARLRAMVAEHFDFISRVLSRMSIPRADLADSVQQVFLVASRRLRSIEIGSERSFLLGTALRVASDVRRTMGRRREVPEDEGSEPASLAPAPDELADQKRLRALLDELLAALPDDLRVVLVLYELEEMSTPEIAALLDIPLGTAASRLRRAREAFDRLVDRIQNGGQR
jgi:RNA polymerase sigma-70 factor (ECF subfamily)